MSDTIEAIYSPTTGRVACVILQAALGTSLAVAMMFDSEDWDVSPKDTMLRMAATRDQWKQLAAMSREERVSRWENRTRFQ